MNLIISRLKLRGLMCLALAITPVPLAAGADEFAQKLERAEASMAQSGSATPENPDDIPPLPPRLNGNAQEAASPPDLPGEKPLREEDGGAYDKDYVGATRTVRTDYEDTLVHIARRHNLGFVELRAANQDVDPWIPGEGTKIRLPARHLLPRAPRDGIIVNLADMRLYAFLEEGQPPVTYPIGVGRDGLATPKGHTRVVSKTAGPTWRPTERMREEDPALPAVVPPGPNNPLGTHALYLGWPTYLIHGTDKPFGIGRRVSSGCIRLYPEDIVRLYRQTPNGTPVYIVDQPVKVGWIGDGLYIEAHPTQDQAIEMEKKGRAVTREELDETMIQHILQVAGPAHDRLDWDRIRTIVRKREGVPVRIAERAGGEDTATAQDRQDSPDGRKAAKARTSNDQG